MGPLPDCPDKRMKTQHKIDDQNTPGFFVDIRDFLCIRQLGSDRFFQDDMFPMP